MNNNLSKIEFINIANKYKFTALAMKTFYESLDFLGTNMNVSSRQILFNNAHGYMQKIEKELIELEETLLSMLPQIEEQLLTQGQENDPLPDEIEDSELSMLTQIEEQLLTQGQENDPLPDEIEASDDCGILNGADLANLLEPDEPEFETARQSILEDDLSSTQEELTQEELTQEAITLKDTGIDKDSHILLWESSSEKKAKKQEPEESDDSLEHPDELEKKRPPAPSKKKTETLHGMGPLQGELESLENIDA